MVARLAALALVFALAPVAGARPGLREWIDRAGVTHLADGRGVSSVCNWKDPKSGTQYPGTPRRDKDGRTHCGLGPTRAQREIAARLSIKPEATGRLAKVHETSVYDFQIAGAAMQYNVPEALVRAIIVAESNFNPEAVSRVGAVGLMQLMPKTAAAMFVTKRTDPGQNILGGTRYLRVLANMFDGDVIKTVAAYNAGPEAVKKARGVPAFAETRAYVRRVVQLYKIYRGAAS